MIPSGRKQSLKNFQNIRKWRWKKWRFFLLGQNISIYIFLKLWTTLISNMYSDFYTSLRSKVVGPFLFLHVFDHFKPIANFLGKHNFFLPFFIQILCIWKSKTQANRRLLKWNFRLKSTFLAMANAKTLQPYSTTILRCYHDKTCLNWPIRYPKLIEDLLESVCLPCYVLSKIPKDTSSWRMISFLYNLLKSFKEYCALHGNINISFVFERNS